MVRENWKDKFQIFCIKCSAVVSLDFLASVLQKKCKLSTVLSHAHFGSFGSLTPIWPSHQTIGRFLHFVYGFPPDTMYEYLSVSGSMSRKSLKCFWSVVIKSLLLMFKYVPRERDTEQMLRVPEQRGAPGPLGKFFSVSEPDNSTPQRDIGALMEKRRHK